MGFRDSPTYIGQLSQQAKLYQSPYRKENSKSLDYYPTEAKLFFVALRSILLHNEVTSLKKVTLTKMGFELACFHLLKCSDPMPE